jgi:recombination protein RecA
MTIVKAVVKKYGADAIRRLGDQSIDSIATIPTGSLALDLAIGPGGIPRGRITEIFGLEESGKSTLCLSLAAHAQKAGGNALFIDMEHGLDTAWAKMCGVDTDEMSISQPDAGEVALDIARLSLGHFDLIVVDSVASLVSKKELSGEIGDAHVALQARMMSQALRMLGPEVRNTGTSLVFTNQMRQKIGVMFGSPWTTSGGNALRYYSALRLNTRRGEILKFKDEPVGVRIKVQVKKNKVGVPYKNAEFVIRFGVGVTHVHDLIEYGKHFGHITKGGAWYTLFPDSGRQVKFNGEQKLVQGLLDQPDVMRELDLEVRKHYGLPLWRSNKGELSDS